MSPMDSTLSHVEGNEDRVKQEEFDELKQEVDNLKADFGTFKAQTLIQLKILTQKVDILNF